MISSTSLPMPAWGIVLLAVIAAPLFWLLLTGLIARVGGWAALAKAHPARVQPRGKTFRGLSLQILPATSYGGCITAVFSPDGLYLVPFFLFRFGHPPLLVPWKQVGAPVEQRILGFRMAYLPLTLQHRSAQLGLPRKVRDWLHGGGSADDWRPRFESIPASAPAPPASPFRKPTAWRGH